MKTSSKITFNLICSKVSWNTCIYFHVLSAEHIQLLHVCFKYHSLIKENRKCGPVVKNLPTNAGNTGLIPRPRRFHMGNLSCTKISTTNLSCTKPLYNYLSICMLQSPSSATKESAAVRSHGRAARGQPLLTTTRHLATKPRHSQK